MKNNSTEILFQPFSVESHHEQFQHGQGHPLFSLVHSAFLLPAAVSPTLQGALKEGFGQDVMACDLLKPCELPSLDSYKKRFLWANQVVDFTLHPVVGIVLQWEGQRIFHRYLVPNAWIFFSVSNQRPYLKATQEDGDNYRLVKLELACKAEDKFGADSLALWLSDSPNNIADIYNHTVVHFISNIRTGRGCHRSNMPGWLNRLMGQLHSRFDE